jgi:hypothetical protein
MALAYLPAALVKVCVSAVPVVALYIVGVDAKSIAVWTFHKSATPFRDAAQVSV